ncbi:hypothetical protein BT69DRAFT_1343695 [Atractiella rhizophila]|nr:hypothetical protein BT69DRAFT_1343695 [Atractiella rhizophila]
MKFGKSYPSSSFPNTWRASAIPYKELKKEISRLQDELHDLGIGQETLRGLKVVWESESKDGAGRRADGLEEQVNGTVEEAESRNREMVREWRQASGEVAVTYVIGGESLFCFSWRRKVLQYFNHLHITSPILSWNAS